MKVELPLVIRLILALLLAYAIYQETGMFTALSIFLAFIGIEVLTYITKRQNEAMKEIAEILKEHLE